MDDDSFRMLANPYRLAKEEYTVNKTKDVKKPSFRDCLKIAVETEYKDMYINPLIHRKIYEAITHILNEYIIEKIVDDEVDYIIESCLTNVSNE